MVYSPIFSSMHFTEFFTNYDDDDDDDDDDDNDNDDDDNDGDDDDDNGDDDIDDDNDDGDDFNEDDYDDDDALLYRFYDEFRDIDECVTDRPTNRRTDKANYRDARTGGRL